MATIAVLDQNTIDKIAAGEVVERPASVVKELVENAMDAGATAITVEIRDGGISLVRITDNGSGIPAEQVPLAFLRHATSKIRSVEELVQIASLGFRGEALSSISAVAQIEMITKTPDALTGTRYVIEGGAEKANEEVGAPTGTTFLVRNLFYNTPARQKFLKTPVTEANAVTSVVEQLALSHPGISFKYMVNSQVKLHTSGNRNLKELVYNIYGRDIARELIEIHSESPLMTIDGFIGKPVISRGNRNFENYYVNGRYVRSKLLARAIEDGYQTSMMQHKYPFTLFYVQMDGEAVDVNVHPTKMEVRFMNQEEVFELFQKEIHQVLHEATLIPKVAPGKEEKKPLSAQIPGPPENPIPEPFERKRMEETKKVEPEENGKNETKQQPLPVNSPVIPPREEQPRVKYEQQSFFKNEMLAEEDRIKFRLIGQVFGTYWMIEYGEEMLIIDQHAAHEKILYEQLMEELADNHVYSQNLVTPLLISLTHKEKEMLGKCKEAFSKLGFEIEEFGGDEYAIVAVPSHFLHLVSKDLFYGILDELIENPMADRIEKITDRCATISCKAAVKGNHTLSFAEANELIDKMLHAKDPYHCPHGRPTTISMSKKEFEKKFKRIVSG